MNVKPLAAPSQITPNAISNAAADARARAIAKLTGGPSPSPQQAEQPVPNATQISPEEMGALRQGKSDTVESPAEQEAAPAEEAAPEAPKAKEDPLSSQYATLARKEKALRAQIQQFKAEQAKFEEERKALSQPKQEIDLSRYIERDRLKNDPMSVFDEAGLSYDEITEAVLQRSQIQTDPRINAQLAKMQEEIKAAREEAKALRDAQENSQKQSYQQAVEQIRSEASKLAYTSENFELIKATNSVNDVVELIETTFKTDGILMTVEEACQAVEDYLLEEAMKLTKVKKLQQKLAAPAAPQKPVTKTEQPQTAKTLTNGMTAAKPMSARERAILAMEGKLKQ